MIVRGAEAMAHSFQYNRISLARYVQQRKDALRIWRGNLAARHRVWDLETTNGKLMAIITFEPIELTRSCCNLHNAIIGRYIQALSTSAIKFLSCSPFTQLSN